MNLRHEYSDKYWRWSSLDEGAVLCSLWIKVVVDFSKVFCSTRRRLKCNGSFKNLEP